MRRGFTLIELVAVVVVLAVLGGVATVRFFDYRGRAGSASEDAVVGAVRSGLHTFRMNAASAGTAEAPTTLDSAAAKTAASAGAQFFTAVLDTPIADGWRKGSTTNTYIGPAGSVYVYDPANGRFNLSSRAGSTSGGSAGGDSGIRLTTAQTFTSGQTEIGPGLFVGAGYALNGQEIELQESWPQFTEQCRRVVMTGQTIESGTFTLNLDTRLTNYWNQLNYWQVYAVKSGTTSSLSGHTFRWGEAPTGAKLITRDYAPPEKSNGQWFTYQNQFTISAQDAQDYDQIVVVLAGSKFDGQILGWRNVSFTKQP